MSQGIKTNTLLNISIASLVFFGTTLVAVAQGHLFVANFGGGVNAPISDASGNRIMWPSPYVADLFWSTDTSALMDEMIAVGQNTPFFASTNLGAGYFVGGDVTLPAGYILAQIRVWDTNYGSTYYEARDNGGEFGFSNLIIAIAFPPPGGPGFLVGLKSFQLQRLPHLRLSTTLTNTLLFSWTTNITNYALQQNNGFNATNWITLTNRPVVVASQNQVTIPKPQATMFYRLVSQ
jgi:hypothetical protein